MRRLATRFYLALGLASMLVTLALLAAYLGLIADGEALKRQDRATLAESLAVLCTAMINEDEPEPLQVVDPVCGMTVTVVSDTPHAVIDGTEFWFCNPGCRDTYIAEHAVAGS